MKLRNSNRAVIKELRAVSDKNNKARNRILVFSIALAVFLLYGAFGIVKGRLDAEGLSLLRKNGTAASVVLLNGTEKQYRQIQKLDDIEAAGLENTFADWMDREEKAADCVAADTSAFEKLDASAYTDIHGSYPDRPDEIMMPLSVLEQLGINDPKIGTEIRGNVLFTHSMKEDHGMFRLSGYFKEYADKTAVLPKIYFSFAYLDKQGILPFDKASIIMKQKDLVSGEQIEDRLYESIKTEDETQSFVGKSTADARAVESVTGSYLTAFFCGAVILLAAFLLSYNVLSISMSRDIRQYGLLKLIGTTDRQLFKVIYRQGRGLVLKGCLLGCAVSLCFSFIVLPRILTRLFMADMGNAHEMQVFYPWILAGAVFFTTVVTQAAVGSSARKIRHLSVVDAVRYVEVSRRTQTRQASAKRKTSKKGASLAAMAWRNVTRSRKRFAIVILSLFLGMEVASGAVMISRGTDLVNKINQNPDFRIVNNRTITDACMTAIDRLYEEGRKPAASVAELAILPDHITEYAATLDGVKDVTKITGGYGAVGGVFNTGEEVLDEAVAPRLKAVEGSTDYSDLATIQIIKKKDIDKLEAYVEKKDLHVDIESLRNGTGVMLLHDHVVPPDLVRQSEAAIGKPIHFYRLETEGFTVFDLDEAWELRRGMWLAGALNSCGYLDTSKKGFPKFPMTWNKREVNYFIMSEKAFQSLNLDEHIIAEELHVELEKEPEIKEKLSERLKKANIAENDMDTYSLISKSDLLKQAEGKINAVRYAMGILAALLFLAGVMNYMNTVLSSLASRKRELALMEGVGMTRRQLRDLLLCEGGIYVLCSSITLFAAGYPILWAVGKVMKEQLDYFIFSYPWKASALMLGVFLAISFGTAFYQWKQYDNKSLVSILRQNTLE